jgi:hypothetical protein
MGWTVTVREKDTPLDNLLPVLLLLLHLEEVVVVLPLLLLLLEQSSSSSSSREEALGTRTKPGGRLWRSKEE